MLRTDRKRAAGKALVLLIVLVLALVALGAMLLLPDDSSKPASPAARPQTAAPVEAESAAATPQKAPAEPAEEPPAEEPPAEEVMEEPVVEEMVEAPADEVEAVMEEAAPVEEPVVDAEELPEVETPAEQPQESQPQEMVEPADDEPAMEAEPQTQPTEPVATQPVATQPTTQPVPLAATQPATQPVADAEAEPAEETAVAESQAEPVEDESTEEAATAEAEAVVEDDGRNIRFQFDGVPYDEVIRRFAQMTSKPIIGDLGVQGTLTFFDSEPYTYDEAMDTLNLILSMQGYQVMEVGRYLRLVPLADLPQMPLPILRGLDDTQDVRPGEIVTVVLPLRYVDAAEAQNALVHMVSSYGSVTALRRGKGLIITDKLSNIQRIRDLLNELEAEPLVEEQLRVVQLENASAQSVAAIVSQLFGRGSPMGQPQQPQQQPNQRRARRPNQQQPQPQAAAGGSGVLIATADERTNMVLLVGPPDKLAMAEQLIQQLDEAEGIADAEVRIFDLANARAEDVTNAINQLMTGQATAPRSSRARRRTPTPAPTGTVRAVADATTNRVIVSAPVSQMEEIADLVRELDQTSGAGEGARIFRLTAADAEQLSRVIASASAKRDARGRAQQTLNVTADPQTNSLIIAGPAADIQTAAALIDELDREPEGAMRELHVVPLEAGDARRLSRSLVNLFTERSSGRRGSQSPTALRVEAEEETNSLIISAAPSDWPLIQEILTELQAAGVERASPATRLVVLKHADADDLANTLSRIYSRRRGRGETQVTIAPSRRSNSLLISASASDHEAIAELIRSMDQPSLAEVAPVRIIRLTSADATNLAEKLQGMLPRRGRDEEIFIQADRQTNSVLLRAPEAERAMLEEMIAQLDQATQAEARELRIVKLSRASASSMADVIGQLYDSGQQRNRRGRGQQESTGDEVVLSPGPGDTSLLVEAPKSKVEEIVALVRSLDEEEDPARLQIRTYQLTNANARELATSLGKLFAEQRNQRGRGQQNNQPIQPRFEADSGSNQLMVAAMAEQFEQIEEVIEKLEETTVPASQTRMFRLEHANAADVVNLLKTLVGDDGGSRPWWAGGRNQEAETQPKIAAMTSANTVVVKGSPGQLAMAEEIVKAFDTPGGAGQVTMQIVRLENAQADTLATAVNATINAQQGGRRRSYWDPPDTSAQSIPVTVTPEPNSNSLLVRGPTTEVPRVVEMIRDLDGQADSASVEMRVYPLKNTEAKTLAESLSRLFRDIISQQSRGRRNTQNTVFSVTADERTNSLVVSSTAAHFAIVEQLLENLDKAPERAAMDVQYIWLDNANATDVAYKLEDLFLDRRIGDRPIIEADYFANAITVIAKDADWKQIEPIITKLDEAAKDNNVKVRVIPLTRMRAEKMAEMLQRVYGQVSDAEVIVTEKLPERGETTPAPLHAPDTATSQPVATRATTQPAASVSDEGMFAPVVHPPVTIAVDKESNSLIVSGTQRELDNIELLIWDLTAGDVDGDSELHVVPITQADPLSIANVLDELFNTRAAQARRQPQRQQPQQQQQRRNGDDDRRQDDRRQQQQPQQPAPVDQKIVFVPDSRTRNLIIRASQDDFEMIEPIIRQLDTVSTVVSELRVFPLRNTDAKEIAENLQDVFRLSQSAPSSGGRQRPQDQRAEAVRQMIELRRKEGVMQVDATSMVTITPNSQSNSIVVAAPAEAMELISQIVEELDQSAAAAASASEVYIIPLANGDATEVSAMVANLYEQQSRAAKAGDRTLPPLAVSADGRANAVILSTSPEMYEQVSRWIVQVEQMKPARGTTRIITLEHADPEEVDQAIQQIYGGSSSAAPARGRGGRGGAAPSAGPSGGKVETSVMTQQRAILINASEQDYEAILELVTALDRAAGEVRKQVKVFQLENASNARIATALTSLYRSAARRGATEDEVTITALPQTDAVVVTAAREKMDEIAGLIVQLDAEEVAPQLEFRIYPLEHAMPTKVLPVLQQMLRQVQQTRPDEPINVQADERTRSIIVTARGSVFEQVEKIIQTLDKAPAYAAAEVLIIPLKRADAESLAAVLTEMLKPSAENQVTPEARALQEQVRLLRVRSAVADQIPELDLTQPIKIQADAADRGANALVVTSTPDNLKAMQAIVEVMDTVPISEGVTVRLLHLEHADAESVAEIVTEIFEQGKKLAGRSGSTVAGKAVPDSTSGKALVYQLNVSADVRTNTLVVSGLEESVALAEVVVKDLDRQEGQIVTDVRVFRLDHADAARLAPVLQAVFGEERSEPAAEGQRTDVTKLRIVPEGRRAQPHISQMGKTRAALTIQAESATNMLVVAARSDVMPLIADVVATMDVPGAGSLNHVRMFPLTNADATRIRDVLNELHAGPNAQLVRDEDKPTIAVDTRTNTLIISASEKTFAMIDVLLKRLDAAETVGLKEINLVRLENAEASSLATTLQEMMDARVERQESIGTGDAESLRVLILADERSNSLIVGGSAESFKLVKQVANQLDTAEAALGGQIQIYPLVEANAGTLSQSLANLFDQRYDAARTPELKRQKPIILPDLRTNSLLVSANNDDTAVLKSLLTKLDVPLGDPAVRLEVIPLKHNDSGVVGPMIQQLFAARLKSMTPQGQTPAPQDNVDVATDALANALIISASKENLDLIKGLLAKVDVEPPFESGLVKMYQLESSDAQRIATMLEGLFSKGLYKPGAAAAGGNQALADREKVAIATDLRTNVLIVSASKENLAIIDEIIRRIDSSADFGLLGDIRLFPLTRADATAVAETLQKLFDQKRAAEEAAGGSGRSLPVSIIPDARTNTLLVAGSRESFSAIEGMIKQLDTDAIDQITEIRVFTLNNADATELADILTEALTNKPQSPNGEAPDRQTVLQFITRGKDGRDLISSALHEGVLITADRRTNSLVVSAQLQFMPVLESLIQALDSTVPRTAEIRVFALQNADCRQMATVLEELFRLEQSGGDEMRSVQYTLVGEQTGLASATMGTAEQYALSITVDYRTNSLLVGGTQQYVDLCSSIITELDASPAQERLTKVYRLRNARASDIEEALRAFLDQERERLTSTLGDDAVGAAQRLLEREVAVVSVASDGEMDNSNTLLLSASPRYFQTVADMIRELDQPPPQVLIQVLLAEVMLTNETDLGFDWNYVTTSGSSTINTGTDFAIQAEIAAQGGFSVAVSGSDLSFFLRALQKTGRLEVLQRPQILASDNQEASIEVAQEVPFVTNSRITDNGDVVNTIQYEDVGILLRVKPRINPDGFIRLEVAPEVSSVADATVEITAGTNALIINKRSAETTVTVQDGHTIVIGGLITTTDQDREDKVPLLGDVPLLGSLFKKTKVVRDRAELLIILTPHVLNTVQDADAEAARQFEGVELLGNIEQQDLLKRRALAPINACRDCPPEEDATVREPMPVESLGDSGSRAAFGKWLNVGDNAPAADMAGEDK